MLRHKLICAWGMEEGPTPGPALGYRPWDRCPWFVSVSEVAAARSVASCKGRAPRCPSASPGAVMLVLEGRCLVPADTVSLLPLRGRAQLVRDVWPSWSWESCWL